MVFGVGISLIVVTAFLVCLPFFRGTLGDASIAGSEVALWEKQKREAYAAIKEAQLDMQMGKLAVADYDLIRTAEEARALEALRALGKSDVRPGQDGLGQRECSACGADVASGTFCAACGARVAA